MRDWKAGLRRVGATGLVVLQTLTFSQPLLLMRPGVAIAMEAESLSKAGALYGSGQFIDAVTLLQSAIAQKELRGRSLSQGYEYLGRCYVRLAKAAEADSAFYRLLDNDPKWIADENQLSMDEVEAFKATQERWSGEHKAVEPAVIPAVTPAATPEVTPAVPPAVTPEVAPAVKPVPEVEAGVLPAPPVEQSAKPHKGGKTKWYIAGAALVGGLAAGLAGGSGGGGAAAAPGSANLPGPPAHP